MTEDGPSKRTLEDIELEVLLHRQQDEIAQRFEKELEEAKERDLRHERKMARINKDNESRHVLLGVVFVTLAIAAIILGWTWNARENNHERHIRDLERERTVQLCMEKDGDPLYCEEATT